MTRRPIGRPRTTNTETPTRAEVEAMTSAEDAAECHELFLQQDDDDLPISARIVAYVSITRIAPMRESSGRAFEIVEMPNAQAIRSAFGGGTYQVRGLTSKRHYLPGSLRSFTFSGPSFPMDGSGPPPPEPPKAAPEPPKPQGLGGIEQIVAAMMQQASEDRRTMIALVTSLAQGSGAQRYDPIAMDEMINTRVDSQLARIIEAQNHATEKILAQQQAEKESKAELAVIAGSEDKTLAEIGELMKAAPAFISAFKGPNGGASG